MPSRTFVVVALLALTACSSGGGDSSTNTVDAGSSIQLLAGGPPLNFGDVDAAGNNARFFNIADIASFGSVAYAADAGNRALRKIDAQGNVTTVFRLADPSTAPNDRISSVATDAAGNAYVGDQDCSLNPNTPIVSCAVAIHRVAPDGTVTALPFGQGAGPPLSIADLAVDPSGNILIADTYVARPVIWKFNPSTGDLAIFYQGVASSLAVAKSGTVYFRVGGAIWKLVSGNATLVAGSTATGYADGTATAALFGNSGGIAVDDAENVYVADTDSDTVRQVTPAGVVTTLAGKQGVDGFGTGPTPQVLDHPSGVAVSGVNLFISMPSAVGVLLDRP
jgi:hypothetical protein